MPSVRLSVRPFGPVGPRTEARRNFIFRLVEIQSLAHVIDILIFLTERSQAKSYRPVEFLIDAACVHDVRRCSALLALMAAKRWLQL